MQKRENARDKEKSKNRESWIEQMGERESVCERACVCACVCVCERACVFVEVRQSVTRFLGPSDQEMWSICRSLSLFSLGVAGESHHTNFAFGP